MYVVWTTVDFHTFWLLFVFNNWKHCQEIGEWEEENDAKVLITRLLPYTTALVWLDPWLKGPLKSTYSVWLPLPGFFITPPSLIPSSLQVITAPLSQPQVTSPSLSSLDPSHSFVLCLLNSPQIIFIWMCCRLFSGALINTPATQLCSMISHQNP